MVLSEGTLGYHGLTLSYMTINKSGFAEAQQMIFFETERLILRNYTICHGDL